MKISYDMGDSTTDIAACLHRTFSNVFTMYFMAHAFHWNVKGPEFTQFHNFFSDIYEDLFDSIDPIAENIRKLGYNAPMNLGHVVSSCDVAMSDPDCDPMSMSAELYAANNAVISVLYKTFECANECNQQGVADFIAGRIDAHEKWRWQLGTTIGMDKNMRPMLPGKTKADLPVEATYVVEGQPMYAAGSKPAPKKDRIYGSKTNKPGSAKAKNSKKIKFSDKTETALRNKMKEHNENAPAGRKTTMAQLKAVYRRGAGAFSSSHRPGKTRDQWAMARVNAYLKLLKSGRPANSNYTQDNDLLPAGHPKSSKKKASAESISASGIVADADLLEAELTVTLSPFEDYESTEDALLALAEFSDLGYEIMPSLRAAWKRAVTDQEDPFDRAFELATLHHDSRDADLLPRADRG